MASIIGLIIIFIFNFIACKIALDTIIVGKDKSRPKAITINKTIMISIIIFLIDIGVIYGIDLIIGIF